MGINDPSKYTMFHLFDVFLHKVNITVDIISSKLASWRKRRDSRSYGSPWPRACSHPLRPSTSYLSRSFLISSLLGFLAASASRDIHRRWFFPRLLLWTRSPPCMLAVPLYALYMFDSKVLRAIRTHAQDIQWKSTALNDLSECSRIN